MKGLYGNYNSKHINHRLKKTLDQVMSQCMPHPILFCVLYSWIKYVYTNRVFWNFNHTETAINICCYAAKHWHVYDIDIYIYIHTIKQTILLDASSCLLDHKDMSLNLCRRWRFLHTYVIHLQKPVLPWRRPTWLQYKMFILNKCMVLLMPM